MSTYQYTTKYRFFFYGKSLCVVIFFAVTLLHFSPLKPFGYPLTLAPFAVIYLLWFIIDFTLIRFHYRMAIFAIALWVFFTAVYDLVMGLVEPFVFFKTYVLWLFYFVCIVLCLSQVRSEIFTATIQIKNACIWLICTLLIFVVLQVIYFRLTGDVSLFAFWGTYSYGGQEYMLRSIEFGAAKANGPYLEPAMLGLVVLTLWVVLLVLGGHIIFGLMAIVLSFLSGSAATIGSMLIVIFILVIKNKNAQGLSLKIGIGLLGVLFFALVISSLMLRLDTIFIEGSSVHYRLVAPLEVLGDVLMKEPFGITFGLMEKVLSQYHMLNGVNDGTTLDNGWYLLVFYFGWPGLIMIVLSFVGAVYLIATGERDMALLASYFVLSPFFTGAVFSPEFLLLQMLVFFSYQLNLIYES